MHSSAGEHGGDLKKDTVTIIGGALDLQEKVVKQAMTPIEDVFMLSLDAKLDYETLRKICLTGHSRVPVYEEVEVPSSALLAQVSVSTIHCGASTLNSISLQGAGLDSTAQTNNDINWDNSGPSASPLATSQAHMVKVKKIVGSTLR